MLTDGTVANVLTVVHTLPSNLCCGTVLWQHGYTDRTEDDRRFTKTLVANDATSKC